VKIGPLKCDWCGKEVILGQLVALVTPDKMILHKANNLNKQNKSCLQLWKESIGNEST